MVHLQRVHETLADRGLVVLGFDCSDDPALARNLLREKGVGYPTILDDSERAKRVAFEDYRCSGVPLNYVVDRAGLVVDAWYGWSEKDARLAGALRKLGLEPVR